MIKKKISGMTLIELLVCMFITLCIAYAVHRFFANASRLSATAETKGMLRQEAQMILRALERDVASSRVIIDKELLSKDQTEKAVSTIVSTANSISMEIPKTGEEVSMTLFDNVDTDTESGAYTKVTYTWGLGTPVTREEESVGSTKIGNHVKELLITQANTYDGKIEVSITTAAVPRGLKEEIEHTENLIIAIKQLQNKMLEEQNEKDSRHNKYWRQKIRE